MIKDLATVNRELVAWATSDQPRIATGFPVIDDRTNGGPATGELVMFLARPNVGKTAWALNVVANNPGTPTLFISIEMHGRYIASRFVAITQRVPTWVLERDLAAKGGSAALDETEQTYRVFGIVDVPAISLAQVAEAYTEAGDLWGTAPKMIVLDYLELVKGEARNSQVENVDTISLALKELARELDVVVVALHQVSREQGGNGNVPLGMRSGRYGGEQAADYMAAAYRPCLQPGLPVQEYEAIQHQWYLQFLKNRAGGRIHPSGIMHYYDPEVMLITDTPLGQRHLLGQETPWNS